jgi:hypothetical protein
MLFIADTTGTQTNCPRPLSRKKLRQLCRNAHAGLTSRQMHVKFGRTNPAIRAELKHRAEMAEQLRSLNAAVAEQAQAVAARPSMLGRFFGKLRTQFERATARGTK